MPGNQNQKGQPNRNLKGGSQLAQDVKALQGAEILANPDNLQLFSVEGGDYSIDINFGLPADGLVAADQSGAETQGNQGWGTPDPEGSPMVMGGDKGKNSDPNGGGFVQ